MLPLALENDHQFADGLAILQTPGGQQSSAKSIEIQRQDPTEAKEVQRSNLKQIYGLWSSHNR